MKKVTILVNNSLTFDNRVLKVSQSLLDLGFDVTILARPSDERSSDHIESKTQRIPYYNIKGIVRNIISSKHQKYLNKTRFLTFLGSCILIPHLILNLLLGVLILTIRMAQNAFLKFKKILVKPLQKIKERISPKNKNRLLKTLFIPMLPVELLRSALVSAYNSSTKLRLTTSLSINRISRKLILPGVLYEEVFASYYLPLLHSSPDFIHANDLETLRVAVHVAKKTGAKIIYDAHEYERERNDRPYFFQKLLIRSEENTYISRAYKIVTVSDGIARLISDDHKLQLPYVIYNTPKLTSHCPINLRKQINVEEHEPLLIYVGLVTIDRCIDMLVEALLLLPKWHLVMVGPHNIEFVASLNQLIEKNCLQHRVHILPPVKGDQVVDFIKHATVGIIAAHNHGKSYEFSLPNKLFEMTLSGLPMVVSNLTEMRKFVTKNNLGIALNDQVTPESVAKAVKELYLNRETYQVLEHRQKINANFSWEKQVEKLSQIYSSSEPLPINNN